MSITAALPLLAVLALFWALFLLPAGWRSERGSVGPEGEVGLSADDGDDGSDDDGSDDSGDDDGDDPPLGDAGKQALDRMKAERNAAKREARELRRQLAEATKAPPAEDGPDPEALKAEGRREALAAANERILRSEIKAAAAGKLTDPTDALRLLDLSQFEVDEDGSVDEAEITEAIEDLIKTKPYLSAQGGKRFQGGGDGGPRNGSKAPSQLTREQLKGMRPEEITKAKAEGRLNDLLGIK